MAQYPDALYTLEPSIRHLTHLLRIIRWKRTYERQSVLLVIAWTLFWLHTHLFLILLPTASIVYTYLNSSRKTAPSSKRETTSEMNERLTSELKQLQNELSIFLTKPESSKRDRFKQLMCDTLDNRSSVLTIAVPLYICYIVLVCSIRLSLIVWGVGTIVLTYNSSFAKVLHFAFQRVTFFYAKSKIATKTTSCINVSQEFMTSSSAAITAEEQYERFYRFVIVQHQRWWPYKGWSSLLLSNDRPEWSDEYLSKVPNVDNFKLPPNTIRIKNSKSIEVCWEWMNNDWSPDTGTRETDEEGWEYGNWDWKSWGTKSRGLDVLTRRRYWVRCARLVEKSLLPSTITSSTIKKRKSNPISKPIPINTSMQLQKSHRHSGSTTTSLASLSNSVDSENSYMCSTPKNSSPIMLFTNKSSITVGVELSDSHLWSQRYC